MMQTLRTLMATVSLMLALAVSAIAQTTLTSTTLAAAVGASETQVNVTSATGIEVNDLVAILNKNSVAEVVRVRVINGTFLTVSRAVAGLSLAHASLSTIYHAPEAQYYRGADQRGTCTRASERFLPHISLTTLNVSECSPASVWYRLDEQFTVDCQRSLFTDQIDYSCFSVRANYVITAISYVSTVAESAGTLTVRPMRQQGTEAAASGDLLATAISGVSTVAQTVTAYTLSATSAFLLVSAGERLGIDYTDDVAGELSGVLVTFTLAPR